MITIPTDTCRYILKLDGRLNFIKFHETCLPIYYIYNINRKRAEWLSSTLYQTGIWCKVLDARVVLCFPIHISILLEKCFMESTAEGPLKYMVIAVRHCMKYWNSMAALWLSDPLGKLLKFLDTIPQWLWSIEKDCLMDMLKRPENYIDLMDIDEFLDFLSKLYRTSGTISRDERGEKVLEIIIKSPQPFTHKVIERILHRMTLLGLLEREPYVGNLWSDIDSAYHIKIAGEERIKRLIDLIP